MKIPIDECPAGPEIDRAIAKVLGWRNMGFGHTITGEPILTPPKGAKGILVDRAGNPVVRTWSTDIAAAWELVEEMISRGGLNEGRLKFCSLVAQNGISEFEREPLWNLTAGPAALAICRAFLKANGVEEVEYETD